jgi:ATP-binding cassette subfamily F protein 3
MTQLSLSAVGVQYGATTVLRDVTCTIAAGERWGLVGRNGSGKTSLFRIITGAQQASSGVVARTPGLRCAVLDQHREFGAATTVWDAVADAFRDLQQLERDLAIQAQQIADDGERATPARLDRYARDLERFGRDGGYSYPSTIDAVLHGLGFDPEWARTASLNHLSGGERGRVALARQLAVTADVLLLDEPTNHLDLETTRWLEEYLRGSRETQLIISHDRAFLDRVVDHVLHLEDDTAAAYACGYSEFVRQRAERRLTHQRAFDRQSRSIAREEDYIRRNIAGQNTRQAKGRRKRLAWLPRLTPPPDDAATMSIRFLPAERGGDQVLVCDRAHVAIGTRTLLRPFTGWIRRGDVVGLVGPNGAGKSTLLKAIVGEHHLMSGNTRLGGAIALSMYTQDFSDVPRDRSIYEVIAGLRPMWERGAVMGHLGRVQFSGDETKRSTSSLSGGELARVALAQMMLNEANFLVFDEPTNHLDVESIEALEDAIEEFDGTVLIVSHDRELLRKLVTRVWELRDGTMRVFDGSFEEWEVQRDSDARDAAQRADALASAARDKARTEAKRRADRNGKSRTAGRDAAREVERAERAVFEIEAVVATLTNDLAEPTLYDTPAGRERATTLARELQTAKLNLEQAMAVWERTLEAAEDLQPERG